MNGSLKKHHQSVHMGRKFQCPECEHQAYQKSSLVAHRKAVHMGQKFHCQECDYQATEKGSPNPVQASL